MTPTVGGEFNFTPVQANDGYGLRSRIPVFHISSTVLFIYHFEGYI